MNLIVDYFNMVGIFFLLFFFFFWVFLFMWSKFLVDLEVCVGLSYLGLGGMM